MGFGVVLGKHGKVGRHVPAWQDPSHDDDSGFDMQTEQTLNILEDRYSIGYLAQEVSAD